MREVHSVIFYCAQDKLILCELMHVKIVGMCRSMGILFVNLLPTRSLKPPTLHTTGASPKKAKREHHEMLSTLDSECASI